MTKINITDTILRDAHQSLIATRMRTEDMLPICEKLDQVGYWSLEAWGGATFDACIRFLKEDPWERLRKLKDALPNTPLQMLLRGQNLLGYRHYADDVVKSFVQKSADNGMDIFRIFDALNDLRNLQVAIDAVNKANKHAQGAICYTTSPVHGVKQFVQMGKQMQEMGCDSVVIKDMAGLLTPHVTGELVSELVSHLSVPVHIHSHATSGLADMCQLKAIENGASGIDTAISSFAGGTSHPPTESMVAALRGTKFDSKLDLELLQTIGFYFYDVRKKYHQFESDYTGVDTRVQINQVPGGMISNLAHQLKEQDALNRMQEVLVEIPKVREELGYPPLVTPTSQIVGTQAVMNVIAGERYKTITNEVKLYLKGRYGKAPGKVNENVRRQAIGNEEVIDVRPADLLPPEYTKLKKEIGELALNEEDVLIFSMFPDIGREYLQQRKDDCLVPESLDAFSEDTNAMCMAATEFNVAIHGETYHIKINGTGYRNQPSRPYYISIDGVPEEIIVEPLDSIVMGAEINGNNGSDNTAPATNGRPRATQPGHVTTSMPGTIVEVIVSEGDTVKAGDPVLITEAMKMETEVQAPITGTIKSILVIKGDTVTPDEMLIEIVE
ncbi:Pyruvate carboxylase subunit B (biotin-containing) [hydrothermal vent metagenome]|uniref:Pyruvate carboxylase subunit B (Biotin-containing) n=1 Tax=hydrothermal vent metagenome TaxID=652676 RepID=A0A3B0ZRD8_9ZZZZ